MRLATLFIFLPAVNLALPPHPALLLHKVDILSPKGFELWIPDVAGAKELTLYFNVNDDNLLANDFRGLVTQPKNGRWTYTNPNMTLKACGRLYYALFLKVDDSLYTLDDETVIPAHPNSTAPNCRSPSKTGNASTLVGQVLFYDDFSVNSGKWSHEVKFPQTSEEEFTVFSNDFGTSSIYNGYLSIWPKLLDELYNSSVVDDEDFTLKLDGCTAESELDCARSAFSYAILPPIASSRITTKNSFSFAYGNIEIRARFPRGDWIVPELWLEPKEMFYGNQSGRLIICLRMGNKQLEDARGNEISSRTQHGFTVQLPRREETSNLKTGLYEQPSDRFFDDFHIFRLRWTPERLSFYIDKQLYTSFASPIFPQLQGGKMAPFDREFYISLGVHVGGSVDFPNRCSSSGKPKPWRNMETKRSLKFWMKKSDWNPTWGWGVLQVDYVKVTAL